MGSFLQLCNTSLENTNEVMRAIVIIVRAVNLEERRRAEVRRRRRGERGAHRSVFALQQLGSRTSELANHVRAGVLVLIVTHNLPVIHMPTHTHRSGLIVYPLGVGGIPV